MQSLDYKYENRIIENTKSILNKSGSNIKKVELNRSGRSEEEKM